MSDALKDKLSEQDKSTLNEALTEALTWLESHPATESSKEIFDEKRSSLESVATPIMTAAYKTTTQPSTSGSDPSTGGSESGPTVEEVD